MSQVVLKAGHVQPVWAGHPWVYPQGIAQVRGKPQHGDEVEVHDAKGNGIGRGFFSQGSSIAVRIFSGDPKRSFDKALVEERLRAACELRSQQGLPCRAQQLTNGYRAFHGEGDALPGLIVDRFDNVLVIQLGTAGIARHREAVLDVLETVFSPRTIIERTSAKVAEREKFDLKNGVVRGEEVEALLFQERGMSFRLPIGLEQKTGFYFDQRLLRRRIEKLSAGKSVLDTYCYVGTVGLFARRGGASRVVCVDSSAPALEVGAACAQENDLSIEFVRAKTLNYLAEQEARFDIVIADPPKFAQSRAARERALKAFRKVAAASVRATASGGLVVLSSCSAAIGLNSVERALALGARDVNRRPTVVERIFQGADHPVPPAFSEGLYLSTVLARVE